MSSFDVQGIGVAAPAGRVFDYVADPSHLPEWASAFEDVRDGRARLSTPRGTVEIALEVRASRRHGTIDWSMTFPDGSRADAFSRVVPVGEAESVFTFILLPPPVPLEQVEGALAEQSRTLREELARLRRILSPDVAAAQGR
jgi:uncharacterized protein YndB with AHSA1/START domain